jgi:lactoylglutathione lyase
MNDSIARNEISMTGQSPTYKFEKSSKYEIKDYKSRILGLNASKPQFLHTMIRVKDPDAAVHFYVDGLGMKLLGRVDVESWRVTALFVGFDACAGDLELAHYWDGGSPYTPPEVGYFHFAIGVLDLAAIVVKLEAMGVKITMRPEVLTAGSPPVAIVEDPDGYAVELIQVRN